MSEEKEAPVSDWKKRELGALWRREGKSQNYLSGIIKLGGFGVEQEYRVVVFTNKGKVKNERAPDFIIYEDRPREETATASEGSPSSVSETPVSETSVDTDLPEALQ